MPFPPPLPGTQDSIAAAMAAAMLGGVRPPDHQLGMPPPPFHPGLPPFPPPHMGPEGLPPPPFPGMPPPFPLHGDHGHPPLDERGLPLLPELLGPGKLELIMVVVNGLAIPLNCAKIK